jgi:MerR family copper efflux transcriptional regulator
MKATLEHLVHCCHGDDRPECPILEELAAPSTPAATLAHGNVHAKSKTAGLRSGRQGSDVRG